MPVPIDPDEVQVDLGTHVFTGSGLKLKMNRAVREDIISHAHLPPGQ